MSVDPLPCRGRRLLTSAESIRTSAELIECARKLAIVCLPVFFQPSGSVSQLIFGLVVCFLTFGAHMLYTPYVEHADDRLAQLCQCQIFFALLSSIALKYDAATRVDATNMDALLSVLVLTPVSLGFIIETPIGETLAAPKQRSKLLRSASALLGRARSAAGSSTQATESYESSASAALELGTIELGANVDTGEKPTGEEHRG